VTEQNVTFTKTNILADIVNDVVERGKELDERLFIEWLKDNLRNEVEPEFIGTFVVTHIGKKSITAKGYLKLENSDDVKLYAVSIGNSIMSKGSIVSTEWDNGNG